MNTIMPQVQPWAAYEQTLTPLTSRYALAQAVNDESLVDDIYLYSGLLGVLDRLQVGFFLAQTANGLQYHLVQLAGRGQAIPDCERTLLWRAESGFGSDAWYTAEEQAATVPDDRDILSHLQAEDVLRNQAWLNYNTRHTVVDPAIHWQAYKLTTRRNQIWTNLGDSLQDLKDHGHSNQDIHDLLYHHDVWQAHNPEAAGMPRDLVLRMHGLGDTLPLIQAWEEIRG